MPASHATPTHGWPGWFLLPLLTMGCASSGAPPAREARDDARAFDIQRQADFLWTLSQIQDDTVYLAETRRACTRKEFGIPSRHAMIDGPAKASSRKELAVVIITPSLALCLRQPEDLRLTDSRGPDPFWSGEEDLIRDLGARLLGAGYRRVIFQRTHNVGGVVILRELRG